MSKSDSCFTIEQIFGFLEKIFLVFRPRISFIAVILHFGRSDVGSDSLHKKDRSIIKCKPRKE